MGLLYSKKKGSSSFEILYLFNKKSIKNLIIKLDLKFLENKLNGKSIYFTTGRPIKHENLSMYIHPCKYLIV